MVFEKISNSISSLDSIELVVDDNNRNCLKAKMVRRDIGNNELLLTNQFSFFFKICKLSITKNGD